MAIPTPPQNPEDNNAYASDRAGEVRESFPGCMSGLLQIRWEPRDDEDKSVGGYVDCGERCKDPPP